ncbi:MAG: aspartate aminotransferase family protein [Anaerolineales bacterium]|nr:aspartate aminotransferase family protein [Anaerolineales bacterium]
MPVSPEHGTVVAHDRHQIHPLHHPNKHTDPLVVEHADGVWLHTTDGRKVLDGLAGLWNVNIGYGRAELAEAARDQMLKVAFTSNFVGMTTVPAAELAYRLAGRAHPTLNTIFFASGGSEANDSAFKTARYYWKRMGKPEKFKVIARRLAYHGITLATTFATGIERYHKMFGPALPGFSHIPAPNPYRYEGDRRPDETVGQAAARALEEAILREGPETVAAFIAEPIQGVGGVIVPPDDYFPLVRAICDKYEVLLITDEVITGFGRTGTWFGSHHWDLRPDMLTFAKGITSGYLPLGGVMLSDAIRDAIWNAPEAETWMHGFTYSGHAAACAVGLKNIDIMEREALPERSKVMGERLRAGLETLKEFKAVGEVRGRGLLCGVELVKDHATRAPDADLAAKVYNALLQRGVRSRAVGAATLAFAPPLIIAEDEIDLIVKTFGAVLDSV